MVRRAFPIVLVGDPLAPYARGATNGRSNFVELAGRLGAEMIAYDRPTLLGSSWLRRLERRLRLDLVEAVVAVLRSRRCSVYVTTSEKSALPLAALLALSGRRVPHVVMGNKLASGAKVAFLRRWPLQRGFTHLLCYSRAEVEYAVEVLGMPPETVSFLRVACDEQFFQPTGAPEEDLIVAVGQEGRDYATLTQAVGGLGVRVVAVKGSPWSTYAGKDGCLEGIEVLGGLSRAEVRDLYARAKIVVLPLFECRYSAGGTVLAEAMAMGKAVVVSRTDGLAGYVAPRVNGLTVPCGDAMALRAALEELLGDDELRRRLGRNARRVAEGEGSFDACVRRLEDVVRAAADDAR